MQIQNVPECLTSIKVMKIIKCIKNKKNMRIQSNMEDQGLYRISNLTLALMHYLKYTLLSRMESQWL